jgi:hypothetical protein
MPKTVRFYSEQEKHQVREFAMTGKPVKGLIEEFCKVNDRSFHSVALKIYEMRNRMSIPKNTKTGVDKKVPKAPKVELAPTIKDKTTVNLSKGEFKIPISNWNVSNENGQFYFIVKF